MRFERNILTRSVNSPYAFFYGRPAFVFNCFNESCFNELNDFYELDNAKSIVIVASTVQVKDALVVYTNETGRALRIAIERNNAMQYFKLWWWVEIVEEF